jgi:hypothetical protein
LGFFNERNLELSSRGKMTKNNNEDEKSRKEAEKAHHEIRGVF